jgi:hypothetical protein
MHGHFVGVFQGLCVYLHMCACIKGLVCIFMFPHVACISEVHAWGAGHVSACVSSYQELGMRLHVLACFSLTLMYLHSSSRIES